MLNEHYVTATIRPWNVVQYYAKISTLQGIWHLITAPEGIFIRSAAMVFEMIGEIAANEPTPVPHTIEPTVFIRRNSEQSAILQDAHTLVALSDHICLLNAEHYPYAFLEYGNFQHEFRRPVLRTRHIETTVNITQYPRKGRNQ